MPEQQARKRRPQRKGARSPRLRPGEAIAAASGVALFALMFVSWYGSEVSGQVGRIAFAGAGPGGSAWQSLDLIPLFLMLAIVVAVGAVVLRLSGSDWRPAISPGAATTVFGGLASLLILFRIVFPPGFGTLGGVSVEATLKLGVFLGLAAALGIAYGGYRAMREEGSSFAQVADRVAASRPAKQPKQPKAKKPKAAKPKEAKPAAERKSSARKPPKTDSTP